MEGADPVLAEGTRVGDFRIRGLHGEGAMGQVYLAQDLMLGRRVALKLIKRSVMQSHGVERFLEEARATASFNHPHIVTLHAVGEHDGRPAADARGAALLPRGGRRDPPRRTGAASSTPI